MASGSSKPDTDHAVGGVAAGSLGPVQPQERVLLLDVLRGAAVLGILLANNNAAAYLSFLLPSALDRLLANLVEVLVRDKFWPLFALLFGIGCAVQLERANARSAPIVLLYLRRLLFLAMIGGALQLVIDVPQLQHLAIAGVPMLVIGYVLRRRSRQMLLGFALALAALCLSVAIPRDLARAGAVAGQPAGTAEPAADRIAQFRARSEPSEARALAWKLDRIGPHARQALRSYRDLPLDVVRARGLHLYLLLHMLVGMFLWRTGVLQEPGRRRHLFLWLFAVSLPIGIGAGIFVNSVQVAGTQAARFGLGTYPTRLSALLLSPARLVAELAMPLAYIAGIVLLMERAVWARVVNVLASVGRMAFTNYAIQALWPALVFGYYVPTIVPLGSLSGLERITVLVGLFGLQVVISRAWLRSHRFGPLEWLWRSLAYWRFQPMRGVAEG